MWLDMLSLTKRNTKTETKVSFFYISRFVIHIFEQRNSKHSNFFCHNFDVINRSMWKNVSMYTKILNKISKNSKRTLSFNGLNITFTMKLQQIFLCNFGEKVSKHTHCSN